jgi:hypothetical protein
MKKSRRQVTGDPAEQEGRRGLEQMIVAFKAQEQENGQTGNPLCCFNR